jgi:DNA-binding CsgD family transcriptional regulator
VSWTGSAGVDPGGLLERDEAVAHVLNAVAGVQAGSAGVVFIVGSAGMGKTSLLSRAVDAARRAGVRVAEAIGSPMESGLPFGVAAQVIVALGGREVDLPLGPDPGGREWTRLIKMRQTLVDAASESGLVLALDDLQWSDPDSLELIGYLSRPPRIKDSRILVVGGLRPEPDPAWVVVRELVGARHASLLSLEPLSAEASSSLLRENIEGAIRSDETARVVSACAGNPLLLKAAAASLSTVGSLSKLGGRGPLASSLLLERFAGVGGEALAYAYAASILGVRFRPALAGAVAGLDDSHAESAHARLLRAGLIDDLGSGWAAFTHALFAEALLDSRPVSERERAHQRAFSLLVEQGAPDALAADHASEAGLFGDSAAIEVTARAGRRAFAQGAMEAGWRHLGRAVELAGDGADPALLIDYAAALAAVGRIEDATTIIRGVVSRPDLDPAQRSACLAVLASGAAQTGRPADAEILYEQAIEAAGLVDRTTEVAILTRAIIICEPFVSPAKSAASVARALELLPPTHPARAPLNLVDLHARLLRGDESGAERLISEMAVASTRSDTDPLWEWTTTVYLLSVLKLLDQWELAATVFEREFERAVQLARPILIVGLAVNYSDHLHRQGRVRQALELVTQAVELTDHTSVWTDLARAVLLSELGSDAEAAPFIESQRAFITEMPDEYYDQTSLWLSILDARRLLAAGQARAASDLMHRAAQLADQTERRHPCDVPWAGVAIDAHLAARNNDRARDVIAELERVSARLSSRWPQAIVALGRARLAGAEDRSEQADGAFDVAVRLFAALPSPIDQADALIAQGRHLRATRRDIAARDPLRLAGELAEGADAQRVAKIAWAEFAAAGGRRRRDSMQSNELTPQEERVADYAADGLTNAQIANALRMSTKTVGHHLERIYTKLGISSRRELIKRKREQG